MSGSDADASRDAPEMLVTSGSEGGAADGRPEAFMEGQAAEEEAADAAASLAPGVSVHLSFLIFGGPVGAALAARARGGCRLEADQAQSSPPRSWVRCYLTMGGDPAASLAAAERAASLAGGGA